MAFKMTPKSPVLLATGRFGSPAKQTMQSGSNMTAAEKKAMNDKSAFGPDGKNVAKPPKGGSNTKADALFEKIVKRSTTTPKEGNKNVKGEKYDKSPAKQMSQLKNNSPAKQKRTMDQAYAKRDMKIYGDLDKNEYKKEANRQINVRNKRFKNATEMSKANSGGKQTKTDYSGGQTKDGSCSREDDACNTKGQSIRKRDIKWDAPKTKMQSKTKKVTTLKAEGPKNEGGGLPVGKPIKAKEIKVTKKVAEAKPTRSQKIRAKGEAALASGKTDKAQRLRRRYDRTEAREEKRAGRKAARAEKKNKMTMTKSKVDKKAKPVKKKAMDSSRMEN